DALAAAVGSMHAMVERTATLDLDLIDRLRAAVPVPLVLHGSSGIHNGHLTEAVKHGMVKINIGTLLNQAFTEAIRPLVADETMAAPRRSLTAPGAAIARGAADCQRALASIPVS